MQISIEIGDEDTRQKCIGTLSQIYARLGEHELSLEVSLDRLQYLLDIQDWPRGAACYFSICHANLMLGRFDKVIDYCGRTLRFIEEHGIEQHRVYVLHLVSEAYMGMDRFEELEVNMQKVIRHRREIGEKLGLSGALNLLANCCYFRGRKAEGWEYRLEALKHLSEAGYEGDLIQTIMLSANCAFMDGQMTVFEQWMYFALAHPATHQDPEAVTLAASLLTDWLVRTERFELALPLYGAAGNGLRNGAFREPIAEQQRWAGLKSLLEEKLQTEIIFDKRPDHRELFELCSSAAALLTRSNITSIEEAIAAIREFAEKGIEC